MHTTSARNVITTQLPIVTFQPFCSTRTPIVNVDTAVPTYAIPFIKPDTVEVHNDGEALTFTIHQTGKPGYEPLIGDDYKITLRTKDQVITCNVSDRIPLASFAEHAIIIPMLFEKETIIENLVCTSPVMHL